MSLRLHLRPVPMPLSVNTQRCLVAASQVVYKPTQRATAGTHKSMRQAQSFNVCQERKLAYQGKPARRVPTAPCVIVTWRVVPHDLHTATQLGQQTPLNRVVIGSQKDCAEVALLQHLTDLGDICRQRLLDGLPRLVAAANMNSHVLASLQS